MLTKSSRRLKHESPIVRDMQPHTMSRAVNFADPDALPGVSWPKPVTLCAAFAASALLWLGLIAAGRALWPF